MYVADHDARIEVVDGAVDEDAAMKAVADIKIYFNVLKDDTATDAQKKKAAELANDYMTKNNIRINGKSNIEELADDPIAVYGFEARTKMDTMDVFLSTLKTQMDQGMEIFGAVEDKTLSKQMELTLKKIPKNDIDKAVDEILRNEGKNSFATQIIAHSESLRINSKHQPTIARVLKTMKDMGFNPKKLDPTTKEGAITAAYMASMVTASRLDMSLDLRDASNCGTNNMCLFGNEWPHDMRNGALTKEEIMTGSATDAERPYIELVGAEENGAFYLASPCVADLSVTMGTCQCKEYYPSDKIYTEAVIEEWGYGFSPVNTALSIYTLGASSATHEIFPYKLLGTHKVQLEFPGQVYLGDTIEFDYVPEGETKPVTRTYVYGESYDDPVEFDAALKALTNIQKDETEETTNRNIRLERWFLDMNPPTTLGAFMNGVQESSYSYQGLTYHNYEQGTKYKKCVKGYMTDTLNLGEEIPCVKIEGTGYPYEKSNYCYEKSWDKASKMEAGLAVGEVVGGAVAGLVCTSVAPGVGTYAGYCAGNLLVSTAGAYLLSGVQSDDKWPNGLNQ